MGVSTDRGIIASPIRGKAPQIIKPAQPSGTEHEYSAVTALLSCGCHQVAITSSGASESQAAGVVSYREVGTDRPSGLTALRAQADPQRNYRSKFQYFIYDSQPLD